ncbi:hypothetical protein AAG906_025637 [Vitis piasezkii]
MTPYRYLFLPFRPQNLLDSPLSTKGVKFILPPLNWGPSGCFRAKCAHICVFFLSAVEAARAMFDMLPALVRDVVSWNSDGSLSPNEVTLVSALSVCGRLGLLDLDRGRSKGFRQFRIEIRCWTSMIVGMPNGIYLRKQLSCSGNADWWVCADATTIACVLSHAVIGVLGSGDGFIYRERNSIEMDLNARNALIVIYGLAMNGESIKHYTCSHKWK